MCYCDIGDGPEFWKETHPVARKTHICCECGSTIDPGEKYWRVDGMWDRFETFKTCEICQAIKIEAYANEYDCIVFGCLYETVGSEFDYAVNG